jgi:hypothetical protein
MRIHDNGVDREMTAEEIEQYEAASVLMLQDQESIRAAEEAQIAARESARVKLARLGLTEDEIAAMLGSQG